jgi:hypothetical protein
MLSFAEHLPYKQKGNFTFLIPVGLPRDGRNVFRHIIACLQLPKQEINIA